MSSAQPVADWNIVAVTASASSPDAAAKIANAFVDATIAYRTAQLHDRTTTAIQGLNAQLDQAPATAREPREPDLPAEAARIEPRSDGAGRDHGGAADLAVLPEAGAQHRGRAVGRAGARDRRRVRLPGPRPATEPRGAASGPVPAADPGADPQGVAHPAKRPDLAREPLARGPRGVSGASRLARPGTRRRRAARARY